MTLRAAALLLLLATIGPSAAAQTPASWLRYPPIRAEFWERSRAIVLKSGKIHFFDLWVPKVLYLETEDGASCLLELAG